MDARGLRGVGMCLRGVFWRWMAMNRAQVAAIERGLCGSLSQRRAALRLMRAYAVIRRQLQTMLWVRACHSGMVLTLSMLRTRNCVSPRLRAWALAHSAVAERSRLAPRRAGLIFCDHGH